MYLSKQEFLKSPNKSISLIGMSGVGKTTFANKLSKEHWFHYSGDYRIGTKYLSEDIMDNIKKQAMQIPLLRDLLRSDAIYIGNNTSMHNLEPASTFLGKLGNVSKGGLPLDKFKIRQEMHRKAEIKAMLDVPKFKQKSLTIYQYPHFINDIGGSICEVATDEIMQLLAKHSIILYLKADKNTEQEIIKRAINHPKPLYYHPDFLEKYFNEYQATHSEIDPDEFSRWIFPTLIKHRKPLYQKMADTYGYTLNASDISDIDNEHDLLNWIADIL